MPANRRLISSSMSWVMVACLLLAGCEAQRADSFVESGKRHLAANDLPAAVQQFKAALQGSEASPDVRILLGQTLIRTGELEFAQVEFTKALEEGAPPARVLPGLAEALVLQGQYRRLVTTYGDASLDDQEAQAAFKTHVAAAWAYLGDVPRAESALALALKAVPGHAGASVLKARMLAGRGQAGEAEKLADEVVAVHPGSAEAWQLKGELLYARSADHPEPEAAFLKALEFEPRQVAAHAAVIAIRLRRGDMDGVRQQAERLRMVAPGHPHMALVDAQIAVLDGKLEKAREHVQRVLQIYPDHEEALSLSGSIEARLGALVQAAAQLGKALSIRPELVLARQNLAEVELRLGQPARAMQTLKPLLSVEQPRAESLALAGNAQLRLGDAGAAERFFTRATKADPENLRLKTAAVVARMSYGDTLQAMVELESLAREDRQTYADEALFAARMRRGELDAALATLSEMIRKRPQAAGPHELRARVHLLRRDLPSARKAYEEALRLDPALNAAIGGLAFIDVAENKPEAALARLRAAAAADARNWFVRVALAELKSRRLAPVAEVRQLLSEAVNAAPQDPEPRLKQIDYLLRKRQFKDALAASRDALAAMPGDVRVLEAVGRAQAQAGDVEQALNSYRRLAALLPTSAEPQLRLGELFLASGARDQALSSLRRALELAPESQEIQIALVDALMRGGDVAAAQQFVQRLRRGSTDAPSVYVVEALVHARRNDQDSALATLRTGIARTGSSYLAGKYFSHLLRLNRQDEADRFAQTWMKQHPGDAAFEYLISVSDIAKGDMRKAEERLRRVVVAYPDNILALNNLAWVVVRNGGKDAVAYARRAVDLGPDRPELLDTLAMALSAAGQHTAALDAQRVAVEIAPEAHALRLGLARIAIEAGNKALAREELDKLAKLGAQFPAQDEVRKLQARI
jgi:putative PEP-CTERM system TPR-repeat lipoprotein